MEKTDMQPIFPPNTVMAGTRMASNRASDFRLSRNNKGEIVLVGGFEWTGYDEKGYACGGIEWRVLPMIDSGSIKSDN